MAKRSLRSVVPSVRELVSRRAAQWNTAEDKGSSVKGKLGSTVLALLADQADGVKSFKISLGDGDAGCGGEAR
ncbi:MAG: hypothetical protein ACRD18_11230 [Terriglobia bacterium]